VIRNPVIGVRFAINGDCIIEFYGEDGQRVEVVFETADALKDAEVGFEYCERVSRTIEKHGFNEAQQFYPELEMDEMNDYGIDVLLTDLDDPDLMWHDDPDREG
jgi:hypothetical protein